MLKNYLDIKQFDRAIPGKIQMAAAEGAARGGMGPSLAEQRQQHTADENEARYKREELRVLTESVLSSYNWKDVNERSITMAALKARMKSPEFARNATLQQATFKDLKGMLEGKSPTDADDRVYDKMAGFWVMFNESARKLGYDASTNTWGVPAGSLDARRVAELQGLVAAGVNENEHTVARVAGAVVSKHDRMRGPVDDETLDRITSGDLQAHFGPMGTKIIDYMYNPSMPADPYLESVGIHKRVEYDPKRKPGEPVRAREPAAKTGGFDPRKYGVTQ